MQSFRNFIRGPVGKILLFLFVVPFIITGFYGYFESGGRSADVVAEVDGTPIYGRMLNERVRQMREQVLSQSPGVDPALLESFISPEMVLQGLVNNELLAVEARNAGLSVSEEQAARLIVDIPQFQGADGKFSAEAFEQFVRARGMNQRSFISSLRQDLLLNQVRSAFEDTDFALPKEVAEQRRLAEQERDIRYVRKAVADLAAGYDVSDEDIQAWYEANQNSFMTPEALRLEYIVVDPAALAGEAEITEEHIQAEYASRRAAMEQVAARAERRRAAHVLVAVNDEQSAAAAEQKIATLQDRLAMGEDFSDLAKEASDDASTAAAGGELGLVGRGDLPESMEQALFALAEGEVSAPVVTDAGYHLVKLLAIQTRELPAVEESRDAIIADLEKRAAEVRAIELADRLEELAFEHSDLQTPSEQLGLSLQTTEWLTLAQADGLLRHDVVREAVTSSAVRDQGMNSELLQLPDGRSLVLRIGEVRPAEPMPLVEVSDRIRSSIQRERALAEIDKLAEAGREAVAGGAGIDDLASVVGAEVRDREALTRNDAVPSAEVVRAAFSAPRPVEGAGAVEVLRLANGDLVALSVVAVRDGAAPLSDSEEAMALAELASVEGGRSLRQAIMLLRATTPVDIYESRLRPQVAE